MPDCKLRIDTTTLQDPPCKLRIDNRTFRDPPAHRCLIRPKWVTAGAAAGRSRTAASASSPFACLPSLLFFYVVAILVILCCCQPCHRFHWSLPFCCFFSSLFSLTSLNLCCHHSCKSLPYIFLVLVAFCGIVVAVAWTMLSLIHVMNPKHRYWSLITILAFW